MSVTFAPAGRTPRGYRLTVWCDEGDLEHPDRSEADRARVEHDRTCGECRGQGGSFLQAEYDAPEVQMSNSNAAYVLGALGLDDLCGEMTADELLGRALIADGTLERTARQDGWTDEAPGRATIIHVGRPEGYLNDRIAGLIEVCNWAKDAGTTVVWN